MDSMEKKSQAKWRTGSQRRNYARKLMEALRHVRQNTMAAASPSRAVREAADRALAVAAKGRTRWSRAILSSRGGQSVVRKPRKFPARCSVRSRTPSKLRGAATRNTGLNGRVRVLGRLVPGCRKMSFPTILDEARDYIAALEMQVKAMRAVAELLSSPATLPSAFIS
ncbi:Transcription factor [Nymphaea thermarum]|nr:Transcription factor [Nymphaea thermarum]